jgi:hypothetical protein
VNRLLLDTGTSVTRKKTLCSLRRLHSYVARAACRNVSGRDREPPRFTNEGDTQNLNRLLRFVQEIIPRKVNALRVTIANKPSGVGLERDRTPTHGAKSWGLRSQSALIHQVTADMQPPSTPAKNTKP